MEARCAFISSLEADLSSTRKLHNTLNEAVSPSRSSGGSSPSLLRPTGEEASEAPPPSGELEWELESDGAEQEEVAGLHGCDVHEKLEPQLPPERRRQG